MKMKTVAGSLLALLLVSSLPLAAQAGRGRGRLGGTVMDENGMPIAGATVKIAFTKAGIESGLKAETITDEKGEWKFIGLGARQNSDEMFSLTVIADGYLDDIKSVYVSQIEKNPPLSFILKVDLEKKLRIKDAASGSLLDQGNALYGEGKYGEAIVVFRQFAAENPAIYQIDLNIADCLREMKQVDEAVKLYDKVLLAAREKADVDSQAKVFATLGDIAIRKGDLAGAQKLFKESLTLSPTDETLAYNVAEICFANGKTAEAIEYYALAMKIKPDWAAPYARMGFALLNIGDIGQAKEKFQKFLELDPQSSQAQTVQSVLKELGKGKK